MRGLYITSGSSSSCLIIFSEALRLVPLGNNSTGILISPCKASSHCAYNSLELQMPVGMRALIRRPRPVVNGPSVGDFCS